MSVLCVLHPLAVFAPLATCTFFFYCILALNSIIHSSNLCCKLLFACMHYKLHVNLIVRICLHVTLVLSDVYGLLDLNEKIVGRASIHSFCA